MALDRPRREFVDFDALVGEAVREIPRWAPGWTDHNVHDPGITLLELLASLAERGTYRSERVAAAHHRAFARRLGLEPRGPQRAEAVLCLELPQGSAPLTLVASALVASSSRDVRFATSESLTVIPGASQLEVVSTEVRGWDADALYLPFGESPDDAAVCLVRFPRPPSGELSLYVWSGAVDHDRALREQLVAEARDNACAASDPWGHYGVSLSWEARGSAGQWLPVDVLRDETRALTISGSLRLGVPDDLGADETGHYLLRCRIADGVYDRAPSFRRLVGNAATADHGGAFWPSMSSFGVVGVSRGQAAERWPLPEAPTTIASLEVRVLDASFPDQGEVSLEASDGERWQPVLDWDRSSPHDRHVLLDADRGELQFGDGRIGWVPPAGARVAVRYRPGGGAAGNVPSGTIDQLLIPSVPAVLVTQLFPALGGADSEATDELQLRSYETRVRRERAITLADVEELALRAPGLPVARVKAFAEAHPEFPGLVASGCVTLLLLPDLPAERPAPSPALIGALTHYFAPRRALTLELAVTGPCYVEVGITARLHVGSGASSAELEALVAEAFARFIHPLHGGADGSGWPLGRDLQRAEVMALLMSFPGVQLVDEFAFLFEGGERSLCESAPLCPGRLFAPGQHEIRLLKEK